jgi:NAD(P) transhydrogenase subunit alpha
MEISHTIINLIIFVLAIYVGYHVVWTVTPGAAHAADGGHQRHLGHHHRRRHAGRRPDRRHDGQVAGTIAVALAAVNVFGGFLVTQRMLEMFKKKEPKAAKPAKARPPGQGGA